MFLMMIDDEKSLNNVRFRRLVKASLELKLGWLSNQLSGFAD